MDNKHWVEELFPPAFGLTVDDILEDIGKILKSIIISSSILSCYWY